MNFFSSSSQLKKMAPNVHDWVWQIEKDKADLNLQMSEEKIKTMSKHQFKEIVKQKVAILAKEYLENFKKSHSKTTPRNQRVCPTRYMKSRNLKINEIQNLYKLRNNMIDVKENFKSSYVNNMW